MSVPMADKRDAFLSLLPGRIRSHITNLFLQAVREGARGPDQVVDSVLVTIEERIKALERAGWDISEEVGKFGRYLDVMEAHPEITMNFARHTLWWESLTPNQKTRFKSQRSSPHIYRWMQERPPSERQLAYLRSLGCRLCPGTMAEASDLIDYLSTRKAGR